jgi:hypothetical protein
MTMPELGMQYKCRNRRTNNEKPCKINWKLKDREPVLADMGLRIDVTYTRLNKKDGPTKGKRLGNGELSIIKWSRCTKGRLGLPQTMMWDFSQIEVGDCAGPSADAV